MKNCTGILCPMQYGKVDPATCQAVDYCPQATPPKSNADKIRAMSDEELATWLCDVAGWLPAFEGRVHPILEWLRQEG